MNNRKHNLTVTEICENYTYVSSKNFTFSLDEDKSRLFGVLFETINMLDATGDGQFEQYPFIVSANLMVNKPHKSFYEGQDKPSQSDLMLDVNGYMGGVPVDHILMDSIDGGFNDLVKEFTPNEACIRTVVSNFGTVAAQQGRGVEHKYLQFRTEEAAQKYIELLTIRAQVLSTTIGFILDRPINIMGESGWSVFQKQVNGVK